MTKKKTDDSMSLMRLIQNVQCIDLLRILKNQIVSESVRGRIVSMNASVGKRLR